MPSPPAAPEFMSAMLTYLTPIVSAGKTFVWAKLRLDPLFCVRFFHVRMQVRQPCACCWPSGKKWQVRAPPPGRRRGMVDTAPYHDRDGFIWYDGKLVPWRQANLHVLSHALHYASA